MDNIKFGLYEMENQNEINYVFCDEKIKNAIDIKKDKLVINNIPLFMLSDNYINNINYCIVKINYNTGQRTVIKDLNEMENIIKNYDIYKCFYIINDLYLILTLTKIGFSEPTIKELMSKYKLSGNYAKINIYESLFNYIKDDLENNMEIILTKNEDKSSYLFSFFNRAFFNMDLMNFIQIINSLSIDKVTRLLSNENDMNLPAYYLDKPSEKSINIMMEFISYIYDNKHIIPEISERFFSLLERIIPDEETIKVDVFNDKFVKLCNLIYAISSEFDSQYTISKLFFISDKIPSFKEPFHRMLGFCDLYYISKLINDEKIFNYSFEIYSYIIKVSSIIDSIEDNFSLYLMGNDINSDYDKKALDGILFSCIINETTPCFFEFNEEINELYRFIRRSPSYENFVNIISESLVNIYYSNEEKTIKFLDMLINDDRADKTLIDIIFDKILSFDNVKGLSKFIINNRI